MSAARLAIVDDDPLFTDYLATMLRSRGYEATSYSSGPALLEALASPSAPQVVLLDVLMPGMNGLETLRAIRAARQDVQVIMLSGQQVPSTIIDAVRAGAVDYVVKPDDANGLGDAAIENAVINAMDRIALESEVARLTASVEPLDGSQPSWGAGRAMRGVLTMVERVADSEVTVLISGESGVGKEIIARELHRRSGRRNKAFVKVNCAALPPDLLESELFGHERGAFTGAQATRVGKFEFAGGGTLMLDEIGELPAGLQAKLLHVLQDGEFTKLGSNRPVTVDARVIGATNRDLTAMIRAGTFREDLYYRLQVIEIHVPPLRERRDEIPALIEFFLRRYAARYGRPAARVVRQPAGGAGLGALAGQCPRARERHEAVRHSSGRGARPRRARTQSARVVRASAAHARRHDARRRGRDAASSDPGAGRVRARRDADVSLRAAVGARRAGGRAGGCRRAPARDEVAGPGARGRTVRRTRSHRRCARSIPLEPPQGRAAAWRELQDPAQQDEGLRHHGAARCRPGVSG